MLKKKNIYYKLKNQYYLLIIKRSVKTYGSETKECSDEGVSESKNGSEENQVIDRIIANSQNGIPLRLQSDVNMGQHEDYDKMLDEEGFLPSIEQDSPSTVTMMINVNNALSKKIIKNTELLDHSSNSVISEFLGLTDNLVLSDSINKNILTIFLLNKDNTEFMSSILELINSRFPSQVLSDLSSFILLAGTGSTFECFISAGGLNLLINQINEVLQFIKLEGVFDVLISGSASTNLQIVESKNILLKDSLDHLEKNKVESDLRIERSQNNVRIRLNRIGYMTVIMGCVTLVLKDPALIAGVFSGLKGAVGLKGVISVLNPGSVASAAVVGSNLEPENITDLIRNILKIITVYFKK